MSSNPVFYIPLATTGFSLYFFIILLMHWKQNLSSMHVFWWMIGVFCYGAGTVTESIHTLFGFSDLNFRLWYILGALLGGAPLAQGTVYLLINKTTANILSIILLAAILVASTLVMLTPLHPDVMIQHRMSGKILEWHRIVYFVPFINLYAFTFLVGGAVYSAFKYSNNNLYKNKFYGNILIAIGGLLPGIGGTYTRYGYVEVLYITEFIGIVLIYVGYKIIRLDKYKFNTVN